VAARYILASLACAFLVAAIWRVARDRGRLHPQSRTWLLISGIFALVSGWLFARG
jgi:uncharacterized membrane protein HdeD (DUF308 family)